MRFHTTPWKHQIEALDYLMPRKAAGLFIDMGGGKTKIMIDLIINKNFSRVLIVAPKKVCRVWQPQFKIHAPDEPYLVVDLSDFSSKDKTRELNRICATGEKLVVVVNYEGVWREPFREYALNFGFDAVICDESHRIKSPSSKCSRMLHLLGKRVPNRYILSGTPLAQSPLDIYAQYKFLDQSIFGTNFNNFKERYANLVRVAGGFTILDKKNPYKNLDELQHKMFSCAFKTDVEHSLPETQDIVVEFDLSPEAQKHYQELQREGVLQLNDGNVQAGNVLAIITRLQQLTSGYLPLDTGETIDVDTSRRDALKELLEDLPQHEPIVIFAKYRKDIKNITQVAVETGRAVSELSGKCDTLKEWLDRKTNTLIVQIAAGAEGIDLTRARYCVYYTLTHSLGQYLQSRKRVHRPNQTRPVVYYIVVAKMKKGSTIDERILKSLNNNEDLIKNILNDRHI